MKRDYQNQNLYTFEQLRKDGDFKHYKRLEDLFYKDLKIGTIQPGCIFTVLESDAPTTRIKIWQDCLGTADVSVQDLQKRIKQIELYTKWRKLVPAEFADIVCSYPGDEEVMRKFKEERNRKARERTRQRKRGTSRPTTKQKTQ
eukprot:jgi/Psemu1/7369/gm1.7369_g